MDKAGSGLSTSNLFVKMEVTYALGQRMKMRHFEVEIFSRRKPLTKSQSTASHGGPDITRYEQ